MDVHFAPFWKAMGCTVRNGISTAGFNAAWEYRDAGGHVPETKAMAMAAEIIRLLG
jgi:hypothetical protein